MKNKTMMINVLFTSLKIIVVSFVVCVMFVLSCKDEPKGCQENHAQTAIDDTCGQTPYVYTSLGTVPVYRTKAVTNTQANGALANITGAYNYAANTGGDKANFNNKTTAVYIVPGSTASFDPVTKIFKIGFNATESDIEISILGVINVKVQQNKNVFMAFNNILYPSFNISIDSLERFVCILGKKLTISLS